MFKNDLAQTREGSHKTKCILNLAAQELFKIFPGYPTSHPFVCVSVWERHLLSGSGFCGFWPNKIPQQIKQKTSKLLLHGENTYSLMQTMKSKQCNVGPYTPEDFLNIFASHLYQLKLEQN